MKAYHKITSVFEVFQQIKSLTTEEILEKSSRIVSPYEDDLENSRGGELVQFAELLKTDVTTVIDSKKQEPLELQFYKLLLNNSLESCFLNLEMALRIFLSLMITNCSGEPFPTPEDDMSIFFDHTDASARIVGGNEAAIGSHPHMVGLSTGILIRSNFCGGSLISQRTVLTAAHCINHVSLRATVGTNRWNSGGTSYSIARNVTHPHYVHSIIKNDIGVLITTSNVVLSNLVQVVPITYNFIGPGVQARVAGWGNIRAGGPGSAALLELTTTTIEGNDCVARAAQARIELNMRHAPHVEPHIEVCTYHSPGRGTCNGDSGSALRRVDDGQQFGVVSWGFPCARGAPDMFVRLSAYQSWLRSVIV
ncbi:hypothetical protein HF086_018197 [Spodoptera exigua]|uniref:Peptidase S1 domain-containing protein n=1 Tax=Spodoptera exigua TaxID=7107 RepID=A0A922MMK6_SPOEX|nr:hypothetical protein HF086_018197 [Spodoptera exigua]